MLTFSMPQHTSSEVTVGYNTIRFKCKIEPNYDDSEKLITYKASCWDFDDFCIGKTKRRLHGRKNWTFKSLTNDAKDRKRKCCLST